MKKVSIIIPTLNRAHLLKSALKSAVEQDYENLEIVVCDDCSEDNTREVVELFGNRNIVYVRAEKRLNMPDTFEFALSKATGDYITFLTDACYLMPNCISLAIKKMEEFNSCLAMWKHCGYFSSDWFEKERKNVVQIPKITRNYYLINSKDALRRFYNNIREEVIPKSINSLCHRSVIEKVKKKQGRFFISSTPDHASAASMLINTENFVFLDKLLFVGSVSSANIGASQSFNLGKGAQNFLKGFAGKKIEEVSFLGIYTTSALIIKSLENVKKFYSDGCPDINMKNAILEIIDSLSKLQIYKTDVGNYWKTIGSFISGRYPEMKAFFWRKKIKSLIKWRGVKIIRSSPFLYNFESFIRGVKILRGNKYGFNNIEEAAKIVESINNKNNIK